MARKVKADYFWEILVKTFLNFENLNPVLTALDALCIYWMRQSVFDLWINQGKVIRVVL